MAGHASQMQQKVDSSNCHQALNSLGVGVCVCSVDGAVQSIDTTAIRLLGLSDHVVEEAGKARCSLESLLKPETDRQLCVDALRGHAGQAVRCRPPGRSNSDVCVVCHAFLCEDEDEAESIVAVLREEGAPAGHADCWRSAMLEAMDDVVAVMSTGDGAFVDVNDAVSRTLGYTKEAFLQRSFVDISYGTPPYGEQDARLLLSEIALDTMPWAEWRLIKGDGSPIWVELHARHLSFGDEPRILATFRDITRRKEAQEELVRVREALDDCGSCVVITDPQLAIRYGNSVFAQLFGFRRNETRGSGIEGIFANRDDIAAIGKSVLAGVSWHDEVSLVAKDGREFPAFMRCTPVMEEGYDITGVLFIFNDITERKQLEAQLLQSQNLKSVGQLAAGIAHEINTPMQYVGDNIRFLEDSFADLSKAIDACAEILEGAEKGQLDPEKVAAARAALDAADVDYLFEEIPQSIRESLEGTKRVTDIVRAMRQFTHPGDSEKTLADVNEAVQSTITVARNEWRYVADMETEFDADLPMIPCFPGDFSQVVLNLIVNAAHAIQSKLGENPDTKGLITICTRRDGAWCEVRVSDTGCGIPAEIRDRIFDPFFTTKEVGKGTGQGLAISHSVVVGKHGGTLTCESVPGEGATFIVRIPIGPSASGEGTGAGRSNP